MLTRNTIARVVLTRNTIARVMPTRNTIARVVLTRNTIARDVQCFEKGNITETNVIVLIGRRYIRYN